MPANSGGNAISTGFEPLKKMNEKKTNFQFLVVIIMKQISEPMVENSDHIKLLQQIKSTQIFDEID